MKNIKKILIAIVAIVTIGQAKANFELVNNSTNGVEISATLYDSSTGKETDLGTIYWDGGKYTGSIPLNKTTILTVFSGHNPKGYDYHLDIDPKKTKTIFLEWNHTGTPHLKPQSPAKKSFFSKDTNIKAADIKSVK